MLPSNMQFLVHIAKKLQVLHAAGWAHRDLKPGNTIWLPSQNEWALIDFGCACEAGNEADLSFSLYYAPPEVVVAYKDGAIKIVSDPAADVWALGVRVPPHQCAIWSGWRVCASALSRHKGGPQI